MSSPPRKIGRPPAESPLRTRTVRLDDETWEALGPDPRGTLRAFAAWFTRKPGAELPKRPSARR